MRIIFFTLGLLIFSPAIYSEEIRLVCSGNSYDFLVNGKPIPHHDLSVHVSNEEVSLSNSYFSSSDGKKIRYKLYENSDLVIKFIYQVKPDVFFRGELNRYTGLLEINELMARPSKDSNYRHVVDKHYRGTCKISSKKF